MKKTKRQAFNFLRSYFDVFNKIPSDKDKLAFIECILNKQFLNLDPETLEFVVELSYESQRHAIEKSVKGWIRVNKTDLQGNPTSNPTSDPASEGGSEGGSNPIEEEEEEEVKEKVEYTITDEKKFLNWFNRKRTEYLKQPSHINKLSPKDRLNLKEIKRHYNQEEVEKAMQSFCNDDFYKSKNLILPFHFLEHDKFVKFLNSYKEEKTLGQKLAGQ